MSARDRFLTYLQHYEAKRLDDIGAMLADTVSLRDWNIAVQGRVAVLAETRANFENAQSLRIEVLRLHESPGSVAGELRILVNGSIELFVVDVVDFDDEGRIKAIRAFLGRGDG